jgi:hypothetical protein
MKFDSQYMPIIVLKTNEKIVSLKSPTVSRRRSHIHWTWKAMYRPHPHLPSLKVSQDWQHWSSRQWNCRLSPPPPQHRGRSQTGSRSDPSAELSWGEGRPRNPE